MFRKVLTLTAIVLVFCSVCELQAGVIDSNWVGDFGKWGDANNWNPTIVPDNNDSLTFAVTINSGPSEPDIGLMESRIINQLDCYGADTIYLSSWAGMPFSPIAVRLTLTDDANGLTNHGDLQISHLDIRGNIQNTAGAMLGLERIELVGNLRNLADGTIEIEGGETVIDNGGVENSGTISVEGFSILAVDQHFNNLGQLVIHDGACTSDGIFDNNSTGTISGAGDIDADELFRNAGQIYGMALALTGDGALINTGTVGNIPNGWLYVGTSEDVNNHGTIAVNAGGGVTFDCNLVNEPNGIIKLLGGTLAAISITQSADANFAGFGSITGDILIESGAKIELAGPTNIVGDVNIPENATLEISDGQTLITGHTVCDGTIHLIGGTVVFQGGCDCEDCNIINEAGIDRNHFDMNADGIENFEDFAYFAETWLWQASWY